MILYHVTHKKNIKSIMKSGLLPEKSRGKIRAVWLSLDPSCVLVEHIAKSHKWQFRDMRILGVEIPDTRLRKHYRAKNGLHRNIAYYCGVTISPDSLSFNI